MLTHQTRWSLGRGKPLVPSRWQATDPTASPRDPRSDDELYDLRPYVAEGDTEISVTTANPSFDDNIFLATFTMNPPVTGISTGGGDDRFVYVALGDSYQSGEGVGFDVRPAAAYLDALNGPYESGTYADGLLGKGDGCHRALQNYAKINRDLFEPDAEVVLVDRTCSGALIEKSDGKEAIVGPFHGPVDGNSQIAQVLQQLTDAGLTPADVDLVTVGMGGNDAGFKNTVTHCVGASFVTEIGRRKGGDVLGWLLEQIGCDAVELAFTGGRSESGIRELPAKEADAQRKILDVFGSARVLHLNYPDVLPAKNSPAYCGGLRGGDIGYARGRIKRINSAIASGVGQNGDQRLELVQTQTTFGDNALCPAGTGRRLANGIPKANFDAEISRLIDRDPTLNAKLNAAIAAAREARNCFVARLNPFSRCDVGRKLADARDKVLDVVLYLTQNPLELIMANVASRPGATDDTTAIALDRAQGLFHPNVAGFGVLACDTLAIYQGRSTNGCVTATAQAPDTVNGRTFTRTPLQVAARQTVELVLRGFEPLTRVRLRLFSEPVDLGEVTADAEGTVRATVTVPAVNPGVHSLEAEGSATAGVQVTKQILLAITGRPTGEYSTYLCCFTPEPAEIAADAPVERVVVSVGGVELGTYLPDEYGGVLVHVPSVDRLTEPSELVIEGGSTLTGAVIRQTVNPIPTAPSLWATSTGDTAISVTGSGFQAAGLVHSEGGVQIRGARIALTGGTEYATRLAVSGTQPTVRPAAVRVQPGQGSPQVSDVAAYRPGGPIATSGVPYRAIDPTACRNGVWSPLPGEVLTGVVYVPCAVTFSSGNVVSATLAAEGAVRLTGYGLKLGVSSPGAPSVVTGARGEDAVLVTGANTTLIGAVHAAGGSVRVVGANVRLECGIVASAITVQGSGVLAPMSERCLRP